MSVKYYGNIDIDIKGDNKIYASPTTNKLIIISRTKIEKQITTAGHGQKQVVVVTIHSSGFKIYLGSKRG